MRFEGRIEKVTKAYEIKDELAAIIDELEDTLDDTFREERAIHILVGEIAYALHTLHEDGICKDVIKELESRENFEACLKRNEKVCQWK